MPQMPQRKKVAAYARVSMETERLQHSLSAQISYYSELIQKHAGWQYVGVYADEGISGTKTNRRDEFLRMVEDCEAGKIDLVRMMSIFPVCQKYRGSSKHRSTSQGARDFRSLRERKHRFPVRGWRADANAARFFCTGGSPQHLG